MHRVPFVLYRFAPLRSAVFGVLSAAEDSRQVRFWDFAGMDSSGRSFRGIEPNEGHPVLSLSALFCLLSILKTA
jgi:hypothetical protein